jgi:AcrR family transcriptional regulator
MTSRGEETRANIANAALELLREKGSAGLTMRGVATATGLSLSNVQYHFKNRASLLDGITTHHLRRCSDALERAVRDAGGLSLRTILVASLCDERVLATGPAFRELFALARTEPKVEAQLNAYYAASHERFTEFLGTISDAPRTTRIEVATVLMTSIEGAYLLMNATPVGARRLAERLEDVALCMLDPG